MQNSNLFEKEGMDDSMNDSMNDSINNTIDKETNNGIDNITTIVQNITIDNRPTFYFNDSNQPIRAGGILYYRINSNKIELLVIENTMTHIIEDIGGKSDIVDKSYNDMIAREVYEETNNIIKYGDVLRTLKHSTNINYNRKCKYILYIVKADPCIAKLTQKDFGTIETYSNFERTISWISRDDYFKRTLNPRLDYYEFKKTISRLK